LIEEGLEREGLTPNRLTIWTYLMTWNPDESKAVQEVLKTLASVKSLPASDANDTICGIIVFDYKGALEYPGKFTDDIEALAYFTPIFISITMFGFMVKSAM